MDDWRQTLKDFFAEEGAAETEAQQALGQRRAEARRFIEDQVIPAFQELAPAFGNHGRRVDADSSFKDKDNPSAYFRVNRLTFNPRDPNRAGEQREFVYTVKLAVATRTIHFRTEHWPRSAVRRANPAQPDGGINVPNATLGDYPKDWIIEDVLTEYTAYMRSERK